MNAPATITAASPAVYRCIAAVSAKLAKEGISKSRKNAQQGYSFRGIDEVYNALAPIIAESGLCILPRMVDRSVVERATKSGGALFYTTVTAEFDFVAAEDGSVHTVRTYGEAMDSADKSTNKAMSAAYKYAAMQAFCIPTEGDNDADATTHEVAARSAPQQRSVNDAQPTTKPARGKPEALTGPMKTRAEARVKYGEIVRELHACADEDQLEAYLDTAASFIGQFERELPDAWKGDGADFKGLRREIDEARIACAQADQGEQMVGYVRAG